VSELQDANAGCGGGGGGGTVTQEAERRAELNNARQRRTDLGCAAKKKELAGRFKTSIKGGAG